MKPYIAFRKRFILPIRYLFEEIRLVSRVEYPDRADLLLRIDEYKNQLIKAQQKKLKDEANLLSIRIEELTWVAYGNSKEKKC